MNGKAKNGMLAALTAGLLVGGVVALAQDGGTQPSTTPSTAQSDAAPRGLGMSDLGLLRGRMGPGMGHRRHGLGFGLRGFGERGLGFLGLPAAGSTLTATFYDGDPEAGGAVLETLTLQVGAESELSFAQAFREAAQDAAYVVVAVSEQTRTLTLGGADDASARRPRLSAGLFGLERLTLGSTLTVTFFDGDPEAGGAETQSLSFTLGEDSETAFRTAYQEAAAGATHVRVTISPQERTIRLLGGAEPESADPLG